MVLAHDWTADGLAADIIEGAVLVTGVTDCEPVLDITVNEGVRLEPVAARRLSPLRNPPQRALPLLIAVRGAEPPLWIKMSQHYTVPCRADGIECGYMDMPNRDLGVSSLVNAALTMMPPSSMSSSTLSAGAYAQIRPARTPESAEFKPAHNTERASS